MHKQRIKAKSDRKKMSKFVIKYHRSIAGGFKPGFPSLDIAHDAITRCSIGAAIDTPGSRKQASDQKT